MSTIRLNFHRVAKAEVKTVEHHPDSVVEPYTHVSIRLADTGGDTDWIDIYFDGRVDIAEQVIEAVPFETEVLS